MALLLANLRYWPTVSPIVHAQLRRWESHARTIPNETLRTLALTKLHEEGFNTEVAATIATIIPRPHRTPLVHAIVALQVMYDYLDGLTELPHSQTPQANNTRLYKAFTDAVNLHSNTEPDDYYRLCKYRNDGGYLRALSKTVSTQLQTLHQANDILAIAHTSAIRCATAQSLVHAAPKQGQAQLTQWALRESHNTGLDWREFLAGAVASVLAVHALIAAAADRNSTQKTASNLDSAYLAISAISTMLDSLIDYDKDTATDSAWYLKHLNDPKEIADHLQHTTRHAITRLRGLPNEAHHVMTLAGVVAYYASAPAARADIARPAVTQTQHELQPIITPTLFVMRTWRNTKRLHTTWRHTK